MRKFGIDFPGNLKKIDNLIKFSKKFTYGCTEKILKKFLSKNLINIDHFLMIIIFF